MDLASSTDGVLLTFEDLLVSFDFSTDSLVELLRS